MNQRRLAFSCLHASIKQSDRCQVKKDEQEYRTVRETREQQNVNITNIINL